MTVWVKSHKPHFPLPLSAPIVYLSIRFLYLPFKLAVQHFHVGMGRDLTILGRILKIGVIPLDATVYH